MGRRPALYLIMGAVDYDPVTVKDEDENEEYLGYKKVRLPSLEAEGQTAEERDRLAGVCWHLCKPDGNPKSLSEVYLKRKAVRGFVIDKLYDNLILWAIASCDKSYRIGGYFPIHSTRIEEYVSVTQDRIRKYLEMPEDEVPEHSRRFIQFVRTERLYTLFDEIRTQMWIDSANWILNEVMGLGIPPEKFKLYLYWEWS